MQIRKQFYVAPSKLLCKSFKRDDTAAKSFDTLATNLNVQVKFFKWFDIPFIFRIVSKVVLSARKKKISIKLTIHCSTCKQECIIFLKELYNLKQA